jgi:hypothetical protein
MLTIRHEQLEALRRPASASFEQRRCDALEQSHPHEVAALGPEGIRELVDQGLRSGWRSAGLEDEDELARLVVLMLQLGRDFERSPDRERALAWRRPRVRLTSRRCGSLH